MLPVTAALVHVQRSGHTPPALVVNLHSHSQGCQQSLPYRRFALLAVSRLGCGRSLGQLLVVLELE